MATVENVDVVRNEIIKNPRKLLNSVSVSTGLKKNTVQKILKAELKFDPYKLQIVHE